MNGTPPTSLQHSGVCIGVLGRALQRKKAIKRPSLLAVDLEGLRDHSPPGPRPGPHWLTKESTRSPGPWAPGRGPERTTAPRPLRIRH